MSFFYTSVDRRGNDLLVIGYKNGKRFEKKVHNWEPTLYLKSNTPTEYTTLSGDYVKPTNPGNFSDCWKFLNNHKDTSNMTVYGNQDYVQQFIFEYFGSGKNDPDFSQIRIYSLDIENPNRTHALPENPVNEINAISVHDYNKDIVYAWGIVPDGQDDYVPEESNVVYKACKDEQELLQYFVAWWNNTPPDIVTGWNTKLFDIPYIIERLKRVAPDLVKKMSPWGEVKHRIVQTAFGESFTYDMLGISQLDYMDVFKKFAYEYGTQSSYKLDAIAEVVLGDKKVDYSEYGSLYNLYHQNYPLYMKYNVKDTTIVSRIEHKTKLIQQCLTMSYMSLSNFEKVFGPVGLWDNLLYARLAERNIVVPPKRHDNFDKGIEGGYVKPPLVGRHKWILTVDATSLYPMIMCTFNMSIETIVNDVISGVSVDSIVNEYFPEIPEGLTICATGQLFKTDKLGIIPEIIGQMFARRKAAKTEMKLALNELQEDGLTPERLQHLQDLAVALNNEQMSIKILMNSLYGATCNVGFRYFDQRISEGITHSGQMVIKWAEKEMNRLMNGYLGTTDVDYVVAIDTDSIMVCVDEIVKFNGWENLLEDETTTKLDEWCESVVQPMFDQTYADLMEKLQSAQQKISFKREAIADVGIFIAKKRYILNVRDNEGVRYHDPKLKMMGIEAVRSSTPIFYRKKIEEVLKIFMTGTENDVQSFVDTVKKDTMTQPLNQVAFPRSANNMEKWESKRDIYQKGTPVAVRAALMHNHLKETKHLDDLAPILSGDKIMWVYLEKPNPTNENVIAFQGDLDSRFEVDDFVDRRLQFEKGFFQPIDKIAGACGWSAKYKPSLKRFLKKK